MQTRRPHRRYQHHGDDDEEQLALFFAGSFACFPGGGFNPCSFGGHVDIALLSGR